MANTRKRIIPYTNMNTVLYGIDGADTVDVAYTFVTRFRIPAGTMAFDVVFPNFGGNATVITSVWGTVPSLDGTYAITNPTALTVKSVAISETALASGSSSYPSFLVSDSVQYYSNVESFIEIRTLVAAQAGNQYTLHMSTSDVLPNGFTKNIAAGGFGGDKITGNPALWVDSLDATAYVMFNYIRTYSTQKKIHVLHTGDSLARGVCGASADGKYSPLFLASQIDNRISPNVYARGGDLCRIFSRRSSTYADALKPNLVIMPPYSPNDASSIWHSSFGVALHTATKLRSVGINVVMTTPIPWDYSGSDLVKWQEIRANVISVSDGWKVPYIDFSTVLEDPNVAGKLKDEYYSNGATAAIRSHPNMDGKVAMANEIVRVVGLLAT